MLSGHIPNRVYLACGSTDMRKSIDGLAAIVTFSFKLDVFSDSLFVFCNRGRDKLKILIWRDAVKSAQPLAANFSSGNVYISIPGSNQEL